MEMLRVVMTIGVIAGVGFVVRAEAQPCPEFVKLRSSANEVWREAMRAPAAERCGALHRASSATEETLSYATSHRESCNLSASVLSEAERYNREAEQARDNVCAG